MNIRLAIKLVVILAALLFMIMMGMSNQDPIVFKLKPLGFESTNISSAIMYFIFFGAGVFVGSILTIGKAPSKGKAS